MLIYSVLEELERGAVPPCGNVDLKLIFFFSLGRGVKPSDLWIIIDVGG